jgi:hypothetical protein
MNATHQDSIAITPKKISNNIMASPTNSPKEEKAVVQEDSPSRSSQDYLQLSSIQKEGPGHVPKSVGG